MRRRVSSAKVIELSECGKASYKDKSPDINLSEATEAIKALTEKVSENMSIEAVDILASCGMIQDSILAQHKAVMEMLKASSTPLEQGFLDEISGKMQAIVNESTRVKKWNFEIERDLVGEMTNVVATEIKNG
jgi:hypothetical protein